MALVIKIKCRNTLRRLTIEEEEDGTLGLTFTDLLAKICKMFQISPDEKLVITYIDQDNDVVTMGDDQDLHDACVVQRINPLRIHVNMGETQKDVKRFTHRAAEKAELCESSSPVSNYTIEEFIKVLNNWHTKGACPQSLQHDVTSCVSCAQANTPWREAGAVDATSIKPCTVDGIRRRVSYSFHKGVQCDGCGMTPIVGPRFKSTKRENFDLCCSCFAAIGNEMGFQRIDRSALSRKDHRHQFAIKGKWKRHLMSATLANTPSSCKQNEDVHHPLCANGMTLAGGDHRIRKLDARFVGDITIFDGTEMITGTHFTKIWRLRNIGTLPWPHGTQLVFMGGDVLGSDRSSPVELPAEGLHCEEEIDVSVDLVSPQSQGRYVSHWRLRAPTGQKFGQRIWVLIQVVPNCTQSVLACAATGVSLPAKVKGVPMKDVGHTLSSQLAKGMPIKDWQGVVESSHDGLCAWDSTFSSHHAPSQDRQDIQGKQFVSPEILKVSCNEGCQYMDSLNVGVHEIKKR